jgi:hypothetical protein
MNYYTFLRGLNGVKASTFHFPTKAKNFDDLIKIGIQSVPQGLQTSLVENHKFIAWIPGEANLELRDLETWFVHKARHYYSEKLLTLANPLEIDTNDLVNFINHSGRLKDSDDLKIGPLGDQTALFDSSSTLDSSLTTLFERFKKIFDYGALQGSDLTASPKG